MKSSAALLNQFALAVDNVDDMVCERIRQLVMTAFMDKAKDKAKALNFEVLMDGVRVEGRHGPKPGLQTKWTSGEARSIPIFLEDGVYRGQTAFAYHRNTKLWVTTADGRPLSDPEARYLDSWSNRENLPPYIAPGSGIARTSILIPLSYGGRVFGVAGIEFEQKLACTAEARRELDLMFDALARIIWLNHTTNNQLNDTKRALEDLEKRFGRDRSVFDQPSLFFAASSRADEAVVASIREVLEEHTGERIRLVVWNELHKAGPINQQIIDEISSARYGVCYLSEPAAGELPNGHTFEDNRNVLFEAGMFEALTADPDTVLEGWVPIREQWPGRTSEPPFDIAGHRMVVVPRLDPNDWVDEGALKDRLSYQLGELIGEPA